MYKPPKGKYSQDTPQRSPKVGDKRFHQNVFLTPWDEEASNRKGMELKDDSQRKHKAYQELEE